MAATKLGLVPLNLIVWAKTNAGMGSLYRSQHEEPLRTSTTSNWANVVAGDRTSRPIPAPRHAAPTPAVTSKTIRPSSQPPCSRTHSSTSAIAATSSSTHFLAQAQLSSPLDKTGRVCRGVELDPLYVDAIVRQYEAATGKRAVLIETGEAFDRLIARRSREAAPDLGSDPGALPAMGRTEQRRRRHSARALLRRGQRFESPQLHHAVPTNRRGFPRRRIAGHFSSLPRRRLVSVGVRQFSGAILGACGRKSLAAKFRFQGCYLVRVYRAQFQLAVGGRTSTLDPVRMDGSGRVPDGGVAGR